MTTKRKALVLMGLWTWSVTIIATTKMSPGRPMLNSIFLWPHPFTEKTRLCISAQLTTPLFPPHLHPHVVYGRGLCLESLAVQDGGTGLGLWRMRAEIRGQSVIWQISQLGKLNCNWILFSDCVCFKPHHSSPFPANITQIWISLRLHCALTTYVLEEIQQKV